MNEIMLVKQRGMTFSGFLFGAFLLVAATILAFKLIPAYMEDAKIENLLTAIANDPSMQNGTVHDISSSFEKRSNIDDIEAIKAKDIQIATVQGRLILSADYSVTVPLGGNISLYLEFNPTSGQ